ncbi:aminopeptidase n [Plakobranchus ocellatus]|uniref:Aminopeptidase n n=1 Tax=Plakobranchus ocellatus TaxID=259542 RepID=A0AAV4C9E2_9GAST|nr:aminopeptidase n [Plakobranchus ocellatus]
MSVSSFLLPFWLLISLSVNICLSSVPEMDNCIGNNYPTRVYNSMWLPYNITAEKYVLELRFGRIHTNSRYIGRVEMYLKVTKATDTVLFHMRYLNIVTVTAHYRDPGNGSHVSYTIGQQNRGCNGIDLYYITLPDRLSENSNLRIRINFRGRLNAKPVGLYRSSFAENGTNRHMLLSRMWPENAREVFPCFDEARFKASVSLSVDINLLDNHKPLFNSELKEEEVLQNTYRRYTFHDTIELSTYQLLFACVESTLYSRPPRNGKQVRIHSALSSNVEDKTNLAIENAHRLIHFYEGFLNVTFPYTHIDILAVPNLDEIRRAPGLIALPSHWVLLDTNTATQKQLDRLIPALSEAIAYQWFGTYAKIWTWGGLWQIESFTELAASYVPPGALELPRELTYNKRLEALAWSSWPRTVYPRSASVYDGEKRYALTVGASVLQMMVQLESEPDQRLFLRNYVGLLKSDTTGQAYDHLLSSLPTLKWMLDTMGEDDFFTWLSSPGYPVVSIKRPEGTDVFNFKQERFLLYDPGDDHDTSFDLPDSYEPWRIVISYSIFNSDGIDRLNSAEIWSGWEWNETRAMKADEWFAFNAMGKGFYRVNYEESNWLRLSEHLVANTEALPFQLRQVLLDDAFSLARARLLNYRLAFKMIRYLSRETDLRVWTIALDHLDFIDERLQLEEEYDLFKAYLQNRLVHPKLRVIGWWPVRQFELQHRLIKFGRKPQWYKDFLQSKFDEWKVDTTSQLPQNVRPAVLDYVVQNGVHEDWSIIFDRAVSSSDVDERSELFRILAKSNNLTRVQRVLNAMVDGSMTGADVAEVMPPLGANAFRRNTTWNFIKSHFNSLYSMVQDSPNAWPKFFDFIAHLDGENSDQEANTLPGAIRGGPARRHFKRAVAELRSNVKWRSEQLDDLKDWLRETMQSWASNCQSSVNVPAPSGSCWR